MTLERLGILSSLIFSLIALIISFFSQFNETSGLNVVFFGTGTAQTTKFESAAGSSGTHTPIEIQFNNVGNTDVTVTTAVLFSESGDSCGLTSQLGSLFEEKFRLGTFNLNSPDVEFNSGLFSPDPFVVISRSSHRVALQFFLLDRFKRDSGSICIKVESINLLGEAHSSVNKIGSFSASKQERLIFKSEGTKVVAPIEQCYRTPIMKFCV